MDATAKTQRYLRNVPCVLNLEHPPGNAVVWRRSLEDVHCYRFNSAFNNVHWKETSSCIHLIEWSFEMVSLHRFQTDF